MATRNRKKKPAGTRPQSITFADAFAGIGGFHLALALAGATLAWACEFDVDAADTYRRNFGSANVSPPSTTSEAGWRREGTWRG